MKRRTVQVNLILLGLAALWFYLLFGNQGEFEEKFHFDVSGSKPDATVVSSQSASRASASDVAAIAAHHLFHPHRHNALVDKIAEEAGAALGPAPILMGTMGIGGENYALMLSRGSKGLYSRLKVGEVLDGYTLVLVEGNQVVMRTGTTEVKVGIDDRPRGGVASPRPQTLTSSPRPTSTGVGVPNRRTATGARRPSSSTPAIPSTDLPVGTVRDGKRLVIISTPFGKVRSWVEDKSQ